LLTLEQLKQAVHRKGISKTDIALLCVGAGGTAQVTLKRIRELAVQAGVRGAKAENFTALLHSPKDKVFKTPDGWELTTVGKSHITTLLAETLSASPAAAEAASLRELLPQIKNADAYAFVMEAIVCAEQSLYRAAVVLSWVGAMALLHARVIDKHLAAFNTEALRRDAKWKAAKTADDLGAMKEATFLDMAEAISVIGNNVRQELVKALKLRNGCGHPSSLRIGANTVAAHLETLALNVYARFG
jgi:hypothetical protein